MDDRSREFPKCRESLLAAIDMSRDLFRFYPFGVESLAAAIEYARKTIQSLTCDLAIIGAEGHGKSTLVRAILGLELSPRSRDFPGTVAPIIVEWSDSSHPEYLIRLREAPGHSIKCDRDDFFNYLAQQHNPANYKGVLSGTARIDHPLLKQGLRIVDTPGVEGVFSQVSNETAHFLQGDALSAILVVDSRSYASGLRLLKTISADCITIEAIVCRKDAHFWLMDAESDTPHAFREAARAAIVEVLGSELKIDAERVFILELSSGDCSTVPEYDTHSNGAELKRFEAFILGFLDDSRLQEKLSCAISCLTGALSEIRGSTETRRHLADTFMQCGGGPVDSVRALWTRTREKKGQLWNNVLTSPQIADKKEEYWTEIKDVIEDSRKAIIPSLEERLQEFMRQLPNDHSMFGRMHLNDVLSLAWIEAFKRAEVCHQRHLSEYAQILCVAATWILGVLDQMLPMKYPAFTADTLLKTSELAPVPEVHLKSQTVNEFFSPKLVAERVVGQYKAHAHRFDSTRNGATFERMNANLASIERFTEGLIAAQIDAYLPAIVSGAATSVVSQRADRAMALKSFLGSVSADANRAIHYIDDIVSILAN